MQRKLTDIHVGHTAYVEALRTVGGMRRRLQDIGLTDGARVTCLYENPSGDPRAYLIRGAVIALRAEDADTVMTYDMN